MNETIYSPIKINLSLRIMLPMPDGYHKIYSLFWQKQGPERLTINEKCGEIIKDAVSVSGVEIQGENLVNKSLAAVRAAGYDVPPLEIKLQKFLPAGSGIGAGSGNAAAVLKWLKKNYAAAMTDKQIGKLGADVAFLASDYPLAHASGRGEILSDAGSAPSLTWLLAFPNWASGTKDAYKALDMRREMSGKCGIMTHGEAKAEACRLAENLRRGKKIGRLPNDFFSLLADAHSEYFRAENIAEDTGASAWGLCGSGSAFFALFENACMAKAAADVFAKENWIRQKYILE